MFLQLCVNQDMMSVDFARGIHIRTSKIVVMVSFLSALVLKHSCLSTFCMALLLLTLKLQAPSSMMHFIIMLLKFLIL